MDGSDQELYNKLLFRKVSYTEVKNELRSRNIDFSPTDTFYTLLLKLRRSILVKHGIQADVVETISKELDEVEKLYRKKGPKYKCCFTGCEAISFRHKKYVKHLELVHHNSNRRFECQYAHSCTREFNSKKLLKDHVTKDHVRNCNSVNIRQRQLIQQITQLKCLKPSCGHELFNTIDELKRHLQCHTNRFEEVSCLFCPFQTDNSGSLRSHFSRKHKIQTVELLNSEFVVDSVDVDDVGIHTVQDEDLTLNEEGNLPSIRDSDLQIHVDEDEIDEERDASVDEDMVLAMSVAIMVNYDVLYFFS